MPSLQKSILLEYKRSTYILELHTTENGTPFIELQHLIPTGNGNTIVHNIQFSFFALNDIIKEFLNIQNEIMTETVSHKKPVQESIKKEIIYRHMKGIEISDLCLQFRLSKSDVIELLKSAEIEITNQQMPKYYQRNPNRKRKR